MSSTSFLAAAALMLCAEIKGYYYGKYRNILLRTNLSTQRKDGEYHGQ